MKELGSDGASFIAILQEIFNDTNELTVLKTNLAYILTNLSFLSQSVTMLQKITKLFSKTVKQSTNFKVN
jgi:hypothetical protein